MTVAAVVLVRESRAALAPADGEPALRRLAQAAWAGGALPTVVIAGDGPDELRGAVADLGLTLTTPGANEPHGIAWFTHGIRTAVATVAETSAALLWPWRYVWVDPETVTSLVEAHGATPDSIIRAAYGGRPGFPILIPTSLIDRLASLSGLGGEQAVEALAAAGVPVRVVELGDPGIVTDLSTPRGELPAYQGPPEPAGGPPPDWNSALAAQASDERR